LLMIRKDYERIELRQKRLLSGRDGAVPRTIEMGQTRDFRDVRAHAFGRSGSCQIRAAEHGGHWVPWLRQCTGFR
jgi:hypothetical protein